MPASKSPDQRGYYVYALLDPSKNDEPFYIGKGKGYRKINHYCPSYIKIKGHKSNIIKRYRNLGYKDKYVILADGLTEAEAFEKEIEEIARIGRRENGGTLVNHTDGGEGASGHSIPRTPEWRQKISEAHKGKKKSKSHIENMRRAMTGKKLTPEQRQKISDLHKGKPKSEAHRLALSKALKGLKKSPEHMRKFHEGRRNAPPSGKWYRVVSPSGNVHIIFGMAKFCRENGLSKQHLGQVALGRRNHHKGWTASFCDEPGKVVEMPRRQLSLFEWTKAA
jgi:hypothetical protein